MYYLLDEKLLNVILAYLSKKPYIEVANIMANLSRLSPVNLPEDMTHNMSSMQNKETGQKNINNEQTPQVDECKSCDSCEKESN